MWQIIDVHLTNDSEGEIKLVRLNEQGKPTTERMVLPITVTDKFDFTTAPETLTDGAVAELLDDILETLDVDEEPFQPAYIVSTMAKPAQPTKAKVVGKLNA